MVITLGALCLIILMAGFGWRRGVARLGTGLIVLVVASLLATPLAPLTTWLVLALGSPQLLAPTFSTLASGFLLFLILLVPATIWVGRRLGDSDRPTWDRPLGAVAGGVWGLTLVLLTLTGLSSVARLDRAMRQGAAESQIRAEAHMTFERQAEAELRPLRSTMTSQRYAEEKSKMVMEAQRTFFVEPAQLREKTVEGPLDSFLVDLKHSPFEAAVDNVSPVNEKIETVLRDLTIVMGDSILMARFLEDPTVKTLMNDPVVKDLSTDPQIALAVVQSRYRDLMDNPKILDAVQRPEVKAKFAKVDVAGILEKVRRR